MKTIEPDKLLEVAKSAALKAGDFILKVMESKELEVAQEHDHDIKIKLDSDTQDLLTKLICKEFPDHAILGEEGGEGSDGEGYEWILDPIDGTVNLFYGIPHFCISIACRYHGDIQAGVIWDPSRKECFHAIHGGGAYLNDKQIHVSKRKHLNEAILALGFSKGKETVAKCLELYQFYGPRSRKLRAMGSAALDMAYIAAGRMEAYIEQGIKIWDIAAGMLILQEAGGKIVLTPWKEKHHYHICASNGLIDLPRS